MVAQRVSIQFSLPALMLLCLACCSCLAVLRWVGWDVALQWVGVTYLAAPLIGFSVATFLTSRRLADAEQHRSIVWLVVLGITGFAGVLAFALLDQESLMAAAVLLAVWIPQFWIFSMFRRYA